jgi:hypothetical protein
VRSYLEAAWVNGFGTLIPTTPALFDKPSRDAADYGIRLYIVGDHRSCRNYCPLTNMYPTNNGDIGTNPDVVFNDNLTDSVSLFSNGLIESGRHMIASTHHHIRCYQQVVAQYYSTTIAGIDVNVIVETHSVPYLDHTIVACRKDAEVPTGEILTDAYVLCPHNLQPDAKARSLPQHLQPSPKIQPPQAATKGTRCPAYDKIYVRNHFSGQSG